MAILNNPFGWIELEGVLRKNRIVGCLESVFKEKEKGNAIKATSYLILYWQIHLME